MKKLWLLLLALSLVSGVQAQVAATAAPAVGYRYCALVVRDDTYFSDPDRGSMHLDYGQGAGVPVQNPELAEAQKQVHLAKSVIAVLDYLNIRGWECFSVVSVPYKQIQGSNYNYTSSETRYLLRQRIP